MLTRNQKILGSITTFLIAVFALHYILLSRIHQSFVNIINSNPNITLNFADKHIFSNTVDAEISFMDQPIGIKVSPSYFNQKIYYSATLSQEQTMPFLAMFGVMSMDQSTFVISGHFNPLNQVLTIGTNAMKLPTPSFSLAFSKAEIAIQMDDAFSPSKLVGFEIHDFDSPNQLSFEKLQYDSTQSTHKAIIITSTGEAINIDQAIINEFLTMANQQAGNLYLSPLNFDIALSIDQKLAELFMATGHQLDAPLNAKLNLLLSAATSNNETNVNLKITPDGEDIKIAVSAKTNSVITDYEKNDHNAKVISSMMDGYNPSEGLSKHNAEVTLDAIMLQDGSMKNIHFQASETLDYVDASQKVNNYDIKAKGTPIMFTDKTIRQVKLNDEVIGEEAPEDYDAFLMITLDSSDINTLRLYVPELPEDMPKDQRHNVTVMFYNPA